MRSPNTHQMGAAVGHAGIDPRTWIAHGVVTAILLEPTTEQSAGGYLVEVEHDDGNRTLARVLSPYAGPGYGLHCPYQVDDWVTVGYLGGDLNGAGAVVLGMAWDGGQPVSADALANPADVVLVVRPGASCRVIVTGGGNAVIEARDGGRVLLGSAAATAQVARVGDTVSISGTNLTALQTTLDSRYQVASPLSALAPVAGTITTGSDRVRST